jgi:hypothetical protein
LAGAIVSSLVLAAGIAALTGRTGVSVASCFLTAAVIVGVVGGSSVRSAQLGWGLAALVAASLPLSFLPLYLIGSFIFEHLGPAAAGGALLFIGAMIAMLTAVARTRTTRDGRTPHSREA